ncbi:MAG: hypothetical protein J6A59_07745, partial [Lachnospiraceae bacterium]|nr:hypothetical protein [Lachnospiraceae bacterium]
YNKLPLIKAQKFNFIVELVQNSVITNGLDITSTYGTYDNETPYVAYKILNTPYWLETNNNTEAIFNAIVKLAKLLDMKYDTVNLSIIRKEVNSSDNIELKEFEFSVVEKWTGIKNLDAELKSSLKVSKVNLFGEIVSITSVFDILVKLIEILFKVYGIGALEYIIGNDGTGVTNNKNLSGYTIHIIENLDYYELTNKEEIVDKDKLILYTNNNINNQIEFLKDICENLEFTDEDIKVALIKMVAKEKE